MTYQKIYFAFMSLDNYSEVSIVIIFQNVILYDSKNNYMMNRLPLPLFKINKTRHLSVANMANIEYPSFDFRMAKIYLLCV